MKLINKLMSVALISFLAGYFVPYTEGAMWIVFGFYSLLWAISFIITLVEE